ncbi:MAG TPA: PPC domain-containing protein [Gemmataceae bacterium]|nr:PPC domain-containing protein [Gemmataceae bacterium]
MNSLAETLSLTISPPLADEQRKDRETRATRPHLLVLALAGVFTVLAFLVHPAWADLPSPRFDRLTPLGASAGSSVEVEILGADIEDVKTLLFDHPGFKSEYLKDRRFRVTIGADVPVGTYDVRLLGRFGVSNPRLFAVSRGLTDVAEKEPNNEAATAQAVAVNSAVNAMSDGNNEDMFRFPAKKGQRVVIECQAGKLDSRMDATLTLSTADGKLLASNSDYYGRDPLIDFVAPHDGDYVVAVHDLSYRGGHPYRLIVSDRPRVENVFPRAVQAGQAATLTVYGRNLGSSAKPSAWRIQDLPLDDYQESITAPADILALGSYRFFEHPTRHSVLPTAATCTLTGFQLQPRPNGVAADAIPLLVADTPVSLENEPNDDPDKPQKIQLPAVVSGRFDHPRDADWYEFEAPENGPYAFDVYCERIAGRADPYLVVTDDKGKRVGQELDDFGHRMNAFDGHLRDPSGTINLTGKRRYRVLVQDRYRRGGARFQYVLTIRKPRPDFYAAVIHPQNPGPSGTTIRRGGATYLDVIIHYKDGFRGPITLTAEGLPPGLHALPTTIRDTRGSFVLWADAGAADWAGPIKILATSKVGDATLRREVRPYTRVWNEANPGSSRPTRELVAAVRETAPFALQFAAERLEGKAGSKVEVKLRVERRWPDFKSAMTVSPLTFPGPIRMSNVVVPADKSEVSIALQVQPGTAAGEYTLSVSGQAQVPFTKDAGAKQKANTLVSQPSRPLTLIVKPK